MRATLPADAGSVRLWWPRHRASNVPRGRLVRLAATSAVALGIVLWLGATKLDDPHPVILLGLGVGWVLMPAGLMLTLYEPRWRLVLMAPSTALTASLVAANVTALPVHAVGSVGWSVLTAGVFAGGLLGSWLWLGWAPIPDRLRNPYSRSRWSMVAAHVGMVASGLILIIAS